MIGLGFDCPWPPGLAGHELELLEGDEGLRVRSDKGLVRPYKEDEDAVRAPHGARVGERDEDIEAARPAHAVRHEALGDTHLLRGRG